MNNSLNDRQILPVNRTKEQARRSYDRMSGAYDYISGPFERKYALRVLELLGVKEGETILEIGFGTGHCLKKIAVSVGETGKVYGIDISSGMLEVTRRRLKKARLLDRVELHCGDALSLPYDSNSMDGVFMAFTLELFDTPEIPLLLEESKRVLKPGGRIGVTALSKKDGESLMVRLYEWAHNRWPEYADCRPIFLGNVLQDAGFKITFGETVKLFGLPVEIITAQKI
ncbi:MAG: methyltransferase domain-containing protein [Dehalococcoidales bacterium]|nr:MAG: methyltransferase domain-containing protein [Dehalococcoidales bacterium]